MDDISKINTYLSFLLSQEGYVFYGKICNSFRDKNLFRNFLKDWLTVRCDGKIPDDNELSAQFVVCFEKFFRLRGEQKLLMEIAKYAKYFLRLTCADFKTEQIREKMEEINSLGAFDAYPFLMEVMDDVENKRIDEEILSVILTTVLSLIQMRNSNSMNAITRNFAQLSADVNRMLALRAYSPKIIKETDESEYDSISG